MSEPSSEPSAAISIPQQLPAPRSKSARVAGHMQRCCPGHDSWSILYDHLRAQFPTVPPQRVLSLLSQANVGMAAYRLDMTTTLELAEIMTRFELGTALQQSGETASTAV
jgi:hypothetical protein